MNSNQNMQKKRVLVVEDSISVAKLSTIFLEKYGYEVVHKISGEDAIAKFNANSNIDLVLMDIDLGAGLNGFETAKRIQNCSDVPVIFHSSFSDSEYIEEARKVSRYGYILKDGAHYVLLGQAVDLALSTYELYELHKLKQEYEKYFNTSLDNSFIISALCNLQLAYTWVNNSHPDFIINEVIGKNDIQIIKNEGTEELYELKKDVLSSGKEAIKNIKFSLSSGDLVYKVRAAPMLLNENEIVGVKTISVAK